MLNHEDSIKVRRDSGFRRSRPLSAVLGCFGTQTSREPGMKLLLVEDDHQLGNALMGVLQEHQYAVTWVRTGEAAVRFLATEPFDIALLDIVLPGMSGLDLLTAIRGAGDGTPVIMLTARDSVLDRVTGLDQGADDYLAKPFSTDELLSRLRVLLRRRTSQLSSRWRVGGLEIDTARRKVHVEGVAVTLSPREYHLLLRLAASPGHVITRMQLARGGESHSVLDSNAVDVHICSLRKKLKGPVISTVRGVGYVLEES